MVWQDPYRPRARQSFTCEFLSFKLLRYTSLLVHKWFLSLVSFTNLLPYRSPLLKGHRHSNTLVPVSLGSNIVTLQSCFEKWIIVCTLWKVKNWQTVIKHYGHYEHGFYWICDFLFIDRNLRWFTTRSVKRLYWVTIRYCLTTLFQFVFITPLSHWPCDSYFASGDK